MHVPTLVTVILCTSAVLASPSLDTRVKRQSECFSTCRPKAQCAGSFNNLLEASRQLCDLPQGKFGFCCSNVKAGPAVTKTVFDTRSASTLPLPVGVDNEKIKETLANVDIPGKSFVKEDKETQGHRLFTKAREEDKDIRDAAFKLLKLGEDLGIDLQQSFKGVNAKNSIDVELSLSMDWEKKT